jgi:hypothetical protein
MQEKPMRSAGWVSERVPFLLFSPRKCVIYAYVTVC